MVGVGKVRVAGEEEVGRRITQVMVEGVMEQCFIWRDRGLAPFGKIQENYGAGLLSHSKSSKNSLKMSSHNIDEPKLCVGGCGFFGAY